jgi:hypothetical protein
MVARFCVLCNYSGDDLDCPKCGHKTKPANVSTDDDIEDQEDIYQGRKDMSPYYNSPKVYVGDNRWKQVMP